MNDLAQVNTLLSVTGDEFTKRVHELQDVLIQLPSVQHIDPPVRHFFGHKTYVREMFAPCGSIIVGKTHRYDHICIVQHGSALIYTEDGSFEVSAPYTFEAKAGAKRIFVALEDFIFQTVHHTETTDLSVIEEDLIVADSEVQKFRNQLNRGAV